MGKGVIAAGVVVAIVIAASFVLHKAVQRTGMCTLMGCGSSVRVGFPASERNAAKLIKVCVDAKCADGTGRGASWIEVAPREKGRRLVNVVVVVQPRNGKTIVATRRVTLKKFEPNGARCAPTCWVGPALTYRDGVIERESLRLRP